jgi:subtilisin family serine protease
MARNREGKIHPKLRMIANADASINAVRAELNSTLCVPDIGAAAPQFLAAGATPIAPDPLRPGPPARSDWQPDKRTHVNVFVDLRHPNAPRLPGEKHRKGNLALAEVAVADVETLAGRSGVAMVSAAEPLKFAAPPQEEAPAAPASKQPPVPKGTKLGPVLVGIIDVLGFDFAHPDFVEVAPDGARKTRFVRIWDQGGATRKPPSYAAKGKAPRYTYGAEITDTHMNKAIAQQATTGITATTFEPQSVMAPGSHGTHVASIAAGASGGCPHALVAGVLIALPEADLDRRKSFYDSSRIVDAVEYLLDVAADLGKALGTGGPLPISINISLGTNGDAHDGSSPTCRWIENAVAIAGRCVTVAAGNAGQAAATTAGDIGFIMGRIHTAGRIASRGLETRIEWTVVGNGKADISENELELWYSAQDRFRVWLLPPDAADWIGPVDERQYIENRQLPDGTFVSIYNEVYHPVNGCNQIAIYLSPNLTPGNIVGIDAGVWIVRLEGLEVRDGRFHGWIERDDPAPLGRIGPKEAWRFPSFFTEASNVPVSQVSSLACSPRIISVANLDARKTRIHVTSSQGPTRDGRFKPDVAAPGTDVIAARGFSPDGSPWVAMTGTSMASPYVAGVAAMMLSVAPTLNAAQIGGIIQRTARPLPGKTFEWATDAGYGAIDAAACLEEAALVNKRVDITSVDSAPGAQS